MDYETFDEIAISAELDRLALLDAAEASEAASRLADLLANALEAEEDTV